MKFLQIAYFFVSLVKMCIRDRDKKTLFENTLSQLGIEHKLIRPYTPRPVSYTHLVFARLETLAGLNSSDSPSVSITMIFLYFPPEVALNLSLIHISISKR